MLTQADITIETVTPKMAVKYLEQNRRNRALRQDVVDLYAEEMMSGNWRLVGDPIRFSKNGTVLDGQHRLAAIVQCGAYVDMVVIRGLENDDQLMMDVGVRRSFGDHLKIVGEPYANHLAAMVRGVTLFEMNGNLVSNRVTPAHLQETLIKYPELRDAIPLIYRVNHETGLGFNAGGYGWWKFKQLDSQDCGVFFENLATGANLEEGNPILTLRKVLLDSRSRRNVSLKVNYKAAILTKAWNKWRAGEKLFSLRWQGGGSHGEAFPEAV